MGVAPTGFGLCLLAFATAIASRTMWSIKEISEPVKRRRICAAITETLPGWFGLAEANASYIEGVATREAFVVCGDDGSALGMLSLSHPYPTNADIYWMGVFPEHHRKGIGAALFEAALGRAQQLGCETMTVETLSDSKPDPHYARTRAFYGTMGFKPMFELRPYGDDNPMVYMVKQL